MNTPSKLACYSLYRGGLDWLSNAPVERGPSQGARSGSKESQPGCPYLYPSPLVPPPKPPQLPPKPPWPDPQYSPF
jgi:hypothetical protein